MAVLALTSTPGLLWSEDSMERVSGGPGPGQQLGLAGDEGLG